MSPESQSSLLLAPFMRSPPPTPVDGWTFEPWDKAVQTLVNEKHRDYFVRAAAAYRPETGGDAEPHALVPVGNPRLSHRRLMQAVAYGVWSSGNQDDVTRDSFLADTITYPGDDLAKFSIERRMEAPPFDADVRPDDLVPAVGALFASVDAESPDAATDLARRVARAVEWYLTARGLMTDWPSEPAPQVIALGVALECLFTQMRSDEANEKANEARLAIIKSARESPLSDSAEVIAQRLDALFSDYRELCSHPPIKATLKERLSGLVARNSDYGEVWGDIAAWVRGFYDLRSAILHGRHVEPKDFEFDGLSYVHTARLSVEWLVWDSMTQLGLLQAGASFWGAHLKEKARAAQTPNKVMFMGIIELVHHKAWDSGKEAMKLVALMKRLSPYEVESWEPELADEAVASLSEMNGKLDYHIPRHKVILWQKSDFGVKVTMLKARRHFIARTAQRPS